MNDFTIEDYMFVNSMAQEAVKAGDQVRLNKIQIIRRKISQQITADGQFVELQKAIDKDVMSRV